MLLSGLGLRLDTSSPERILGAEILVYDRAALAEKLLADAEQVVNRLYADAGVTLKWSHLTARFRGIPSDTRKIRIVLISRDAASAIGYPPGALGFTPGGADRRGTLAYVLEHRVRAVSRAYDIPLFVVLGAAMAHELGHLFLPRGHTATGLMRADFSHSDFRRIASGDLRLSYPERTAIRGRLYAQSIRAHASPTSFPIMTR